MADDDLKIVIEGKEYAIDDFKLGEIEWIEDELGATLDEINPYSIKAALRFVTVIKRRETPEFTVDDARELKLSVFAGGDGDDEPPKVAQVKDAAAKRAARNKAKAA
jgi:hypothetical protein